MSPLNLMALGWPRAGRRNAQLVKRDYRWGVLHIRCPCGAQAQRLSVMAAFCLTDCVALRPPLIQGDAPCAGWQNVREHCAPL